MRITLASLTLIIAGSSASAQDACDIQRALADKGFYSGNITCTIGPKTTEAIENFQRDRGLNVDGVVGEDTRKSLFEDGEERKSPRPVIDRRMSDQETFARCGDDIVEVTRRGGWQSRDERFAIAGWEDTVDNREDYGRNYAKWANAVDKSIDCKPVRVLSVVECVARARPCKAGR